ncbi:MAG TPA: hypothetical protein VG318_16390 [Actinomycetota bacterium]|nr:hypothetical protein [Actinomycetota bacterium]
MRRRTVAGAVVAAAVTVGSLTSGAVAHDYTGWSATLIGYDSDKGRFFGRVGSTVENCAIDRRVKVRKHTSAGFKVVGRTRSNAEGRWRLSKPNAKGTYSAVVVKRSTTSSEHEHDCRRGGSASVTVD